MNLRTCRSASAGMAFSGSGQGVRCVKSAIALPGADERAMPQLRRHDADESRIVAEPDEVLVAAFLGEFFDRLRIETAGARDAAGRERVRDLLGPVRREEACRIRRAVG